MGDINGKIKEEFTFNTYYDDGDGVEGIKHIDVELCQSIDSYNSQVELNAVLDLETLKIKGEAKDVEIKVLKTSIADIVSRSKKPEDTKDKKQIDAKSASSVKQKKK